jgi:hypothetical protein
LKQTCLNNILEKIKSGVNKRQPLLFQKIPLSDSSFPIAENSVPANKPARTIKPTTYPKMMKK